MGTSSVIKVGRLPNDYALREGTVVTWPQMFIWGAMEGLTAWEVFGAGSYMELMLCKRDRSKPNQLSKDAALQRYGLTGRYGHGWTWANPSLSL